MAAAVIVKGGLGGSLKFRAELEGLRGLLILLIAFYHAGASLFESAFFSVDAFFVLSGYLMAAIIASELQSGRFSLLGFYERRARRLLPALYVVLLSGVILAYFILPPVDYETLAESSLWALGMAGNVFFADTGPGYFSASISLQPFMHLWSLGLEQQYYLLIPLVFFIFASVRQHWLIAALAGLSLWSLYMAFSMASNDEGSRAYYLFSARAWEFLVGALAALHQDKLRGLVPARWHRGLADLGLAVLVASCFLVSQHAVHPGPLTLVPVFGVLLLLVYPDRNSWSARGLSWWPLVWIGGLSYSLYLWHQVLLALGRWFFIDNFNLIIAGGLLLLALGLSVATGKLIERPARNARRVPRNRFWWGMLASTLLVFSVSNYVDNKHGLRARLPIAYVDQTLQESGFVVTTTRDGLDCRAKLEAGQLCEIGDPGAERTWALVGDSHASQLTASMDEAFRKAGIAGYLIARHSCGFALGVRLVGDHHGLCEAHNQSVRRWLLENEKVANIIVIGRGAYYYTKKRYDNGSGGRESGPKYWFEPGQRDRGEGFESAVLKAMMTPLEELARKGRRVAVIYPTPEFAWDVPRYFMRQVMRGDERIDISIKSSVYEQRVEPFRRAVAQAAQQSSLLVVDPMDIFCDKGRCSAYRDGLLLYRDDDHLTRYGADLLVDKLVVDLGLDSLTTRIVTRF